MIKTFYLRRDEDESGVSGTGVVAYGGVMESGIVVLHWTTAHGSLGVYRSIDDVIAIHGHNGKTQVVWKEELKGDLDLELLMFDKEEAYVLCYKDSKTVTIFLDKMAYHLALKEMGIENYVQESSFTEEIEYTCEEEK